MFRRKICELMELRKKKRKEAVLPDTCRPGWLTGCESGETNIIAIILIIIVVIALAVIFRNQLMGIVNRLFSRINTSIDDF